MYRKKPTQIDKYTFYKLQILVIINFSPEKLLFN